MKMCAGREKTNTAGKGASILGTGLVKSIKNAFHEEGIVLFNREIIRGGFVKSL